MQPLNKKGGVVTGTVMGVGGLIIGVIVILIVIQTLNNSDLLIADRINTVTVTNETVVVSNTTGIGTITGINAFFTSWNATLIMNSTGSQSLAEGTDYVLFTGNATVQNLTTHGVSVPLIWLITYDWTETRDVSSSSVGNLTSNFTEGIDNISLRIPTILLIVAVVFLFGALVLLIRQARNMGAQSSGSGGGGSL